MSCNYLESLAGKKESCYEMQIWRNRVGKKESCDEELWRNGICGGWGWVWEKQMAFLEEEELKVEKQLWEGRAQSGEEAVLRKGWAKDVLKGFGSPGYIIIIIIIII